MCLSLKTVASKNFFCSYRHGSTKLLYNKYPKISHRYRNVGEMQIIPSVTSQQFILTNVRNRGRNYWGQQKSILDTARLFNTQNEEVLFTAIIICWQKYLVPVLSSKKRADQQLIVPKVAKSCAIHTVEKSISFPLWLQ